MFLGGAGGTFDLVDDFAVGAGAAALAVGDFDGDCSDLAVTNGVSGNFVSVLLGDGDGRFGAPIDYDVGSDPQSIAVGDFNGDSDPDLVTANYGSANVSVLLGEAGGSFGAATDYETGDGPYSVAVSDFDGDSDPDLAVANYFENDVSILRGGVGGSFGDATSLTADEGPTWVAPGDFDGDADPDLAVANWDSDNVSVLLNRRPAAAPGTTSPAGTPPAAAGRNRRSRACGGRGASAARAPGGCGSRSNMSLARPAAVEIRIARAVKSNDRRSRPRSDRTPPAPQDALPHGRDGPPGAVAGRRGRDRPPVHAERAPDPGPVPAQRARAPGRRPDVPPHLPLPARGGLTAPISTRDPGDTQPCSSPIRPGAGCPRPPRSRRGPAVVIGSCWRRSCSPAARRPSTASWT